jgi:SAM-dependent methyltransferase
VTRSRSTANKLTAKEVYETRRLDLIAARWNAKAAAWDHELSDPACHLNEDGAYQRFLNQAVSVIGSRQPFCATRGVVDAGCATGLVLARIISWFAWGIGLDLSPEMIELARAKNVPKARFLVGDCFNLRRSCPKAGAIISRGVLLSHYGPHLAEPLLKSAHDCLEEGGFVFCDFLNAAGRGKYHHVPENKTHFEADEVCAAARRAGFVTATVYGSAKRRVRMVLAEK